MKKLMFAIAGAVAFAAFADVTPIASVDFESYTTNSTVVGVIDTGDAASLWTTNGTGDDASLVQAYGGYAPSLARKDAEAGNNYLALDTNGDELKRVIPAAGQEIAAGGTFIDTLVQFTVSEDEPAASEFTGAKLAIWLGVYTNGVTTTTNLFVQGGKYVGAELEEGVPTAAPSVVPQTYKLSGDYEPGVWYRLTVKAIKFATGGDSVYTGFQVYVDGTQLTTVEDAYDALALTAFGLMSADTALLTGNLLVPSADAGLADDTITSVGFKGTGAIDNLLVTTEDLFPPPVVTFTLTLDLGSNVSGAVVTTNDVAVAFDNGTAQIPSNTVVRIAQPTFATDYELDAFSVGGQSIASPTFPYDLTMEAATTVAITAKAVQAGWVDNPTTDIEQGTSASTAYPALAGSALATADAQKLTTWAKTNSIDFNTIKDDTTGTYTEAYLLNCALAEVEEEKDEFVLDISVAADGTITVSLPDGKEYNGTLQMKGSNDLSTWTNVNAASSSYQFYKYELSL